MKYLRQTDPRFQHLGLKVGGFLLLLGLLLAVMLGILAWRQDLFQAKVVLVTKPERAEGLSRGMDVTLHGIRVGRVLLVELGPDGLPVTRFEVREQAAKWLREDASVRLSGLDPLGTPFLNLEPGSPDAAALQPGAVLPFTRELTLGETTAELEKQLRPVIEQAAALVDELSSPDGDVRQTLSNLRAVTDSAATEVPATLKDARLSAREGREFLEDLLAEDGDIAKVREDLTNISSALDESVPKLLADLEKSLAALRRTVAEVEGTTKASTPEVKELIRSSREAATQAEELLRDIRQIWFVKLFTPRKRPTPQPTPAP
jgi:phospholipid/cholesterol/gamma-HCH transport system substrate-binding protein